MYTLSPGPSQLSPETKEDIRRAIEDGILELSHRSKRFTDISRHCIEELRAYLGIPNEYRMFYFDSATHIWHSLAANLVKKSSFHFVNGSFSAKARDASALLGKHAHTSQATWGEPCDFEGSNIPEDIELITACYNETSTGVKMTHDEVSILRKKCPDTILAIDVTSCAGGVPLTLADADIWYFSVQKCFGLPAGLAIAAISPRAYERSIALSKEGANLAGIWAWQMLDEMMSNDLYQTPHTPNVLNIYLLGEQCGRWNTQGGLPTQAERTMKKKELIEEWMLERDGCAFFVQDASHRSDTVVVIGAYPEDIVSARELLRSSGIELGAGYGKIKKDTFRIANFPVVEEKTLLKTLDILALHFGK